MAHPNENFEYQPLNTMDYDMSMQSPVGDATFDNNIEMFMDPQFWTTGGIGNNSNVDDSVSQGFPPFELGDLTQLPEQKFDGSIHTMGGAAGAALTSPSSSLASPTVTHATPKSEVKRESASKRNDSVDEGSEMERDLQISTEEDKRRRNTAASARFRVKKKQREQAMEKTAKEMTEKCTSLESRVKELEKENKLLKGLLTEKAIRGGKAQPESSSSDEDASKPQPAKRKKPIESA